jgi:flagellar biosynthesis protein FliR
VVDAGTLFGELAAGVAIAVIGRTVISAIQAGGELVDAAAGYGTAAIYSPLTENAAGPLGRLAAALAVACFWAFDAHRPLLQALVAPLRHTPANAPDVAATVAVVVAGALAFAGPALSVVLIVECALALAGRAAPQLNAFVLGLPLRAGLAILATLLAIPDVQGPFRGLWGREPALSSEAIEWLTGE